MIVLKKVFKYKRSFHQTNLNKVSGTSLNLCRRQAQSATTTLVIKENAKKVGRSKRLGAPIDPTLVYVLTAST